MGYQVPSVNQCYDFTCVIGQLQAWCCSHAPLVQSVYDECKGTSLSEQVAYLFGVVRDVVKAQQCVDENFKTLYDFVKDFFENLDLQEEVNEWLNQALEDGRLSAIIQDYFGKYYVNVVQYAGAHSLTINNAFLELIESGVKNFYLSSGDYQLSLDNLSQIYIVGDRYTYITFNNLTSINSCIFERIIFKGDIFSAGQFSDLKFNSCYFQNMTDVFKPTNISFLLYFNDCTFNGCKNIFTGNQINAISCKNCRFYSYDTILSCNCQNIDFNECAFENVLENSFVIDSLAVFGVTLNKCYYETTYINTLISNRQHIGIITIKDSWLYCGSGNHSIINVYNESDQFFLYMENNFIARTTGSVAISGKFNGVLRNNFYDNLNNAFFTNNAQFYDVNNCTVIDILQGIYRVSNTIREYHQPTVFGEYNPADNTPGTVSMSTNQLGYFVGNSFRPLCYAVAVETEQSLKNGISALRQQVAIEFANDNPNCVYVQNANGQLIKLTGVVV